jgi:hypothetical protein
MGDHPPNGWHWQQGVAHQIFVSNWTPAPCLDTWSWQSDSILGWFPTFCTLQRQEWSWSQHCASIHDMTWLDMTWHDLTWHDMTLDRKCMHYAHLHIYCASVLSLDGRWSSLGKTSSGSHSVRITSTCTMGGMDRPTNTMQRNAKIDNIFYMFTKRKRSISKRNPKIFQDIQTDFDQFPISPTFTKRYWPCPIAPLAAALRPLRRHWLP